VLKRTTKKGEQRKEERKVEIRHDTKRLNWRKHTDRDDRKVCAVRYVDECVMASMLEWTQPVPQEDTHSSHNTCTHAWAQG